MAAAYFLDPINWKAVPGGYAPPWTALGDQATEFMDDAEAVLKKMGGAAAVREFHELKLFTASATDFGGTLAALTVREVTTDKHGNETSHLPAVAKRRAFLSTWFAEKFPKLAKAGLHLLSMHTTACQSERDWSEWGLMYQKNRSRLDRQRAKKMIFLKEAHRERDTGCDMLDLS